MIEWDQEWSPVRPRWKQIADHLRQLIADGTIGPDMLLVEGRLAQIYGVARMTVRKALRALREEGLVETEQGMGSSVAPGARERLRAQQDKRLDQ